MKRNTESSQFKPGKGNHHSERCDKNPKGSSRTKAKSNCPKHPSVGKSKIKVTCGFDKSLIAKGSDGRETCFEEARARAKYFKISSENNFNSLEVPKIGIYESDKSDMDMDMNSTVEDVDMDEVSRSEKSMIQLSKSPPLKKKVLFDMNTSTVVGQSFTSRHNTSTASSTVNEHDAVGVHGEKEETVNTKFAARELSMMFASPGANPSGLFDQSFSSERKTHKHIPSDDLLFSGHDTKRQNCSVFDTLRDTDTPVQAFNIFQDDESVNHDDSSSFINPKDQGNGERDTDTLRDKDTPVQAFKIFQDDESGNHDDSSRFIHPEDQGNGDTASFGDIMELMEDNDASGSESDCNSPRKSSNRKGILKRTNGGGGFPIFRDVENDVDPAPVFGDISFIPQGGDDNTCPDLSSKMRGMGLTDR